MSPALTVYQAETSLLAQRHAEAEVDEMRLREDLGRSLVLALRTAAALVVLALFMADHDHHPHVHLPHELVMPVFQPECPCPGPSLTAGGGDGEA